MRKALYIFGVCLLGQVSVSAQPPDANPPARDPEQIPVEIIAQIKQTPRDALGNFLGRIHWGDWDDITTFVQDAKQDNDALARVRQEITKAFGTLNIGFADDIEEKIDGDEATLKIKGIARFHVGVFFPWKESITFHREGVKWIDNRGQQREYSVWRLVPNQPQKVLMSNECIGALATYIAYPRQMLSLLDTQASADQIKQLSLGVAQFVQDYNEKFAFTQETYRKEITRYIERSEIWTAPGDAVGTQSYSFNESLLSRKLSDIADAKKTVMIFLNKDGKMDFRYDGKTVVGFVDGHVEILNSEQAKNLRWEP